MDKIDQTWCKISNWMPTAHTHTCTHTLSPVKWASDAWLQNRAQNRKAGKERKDTLMCLRHMLLATDGCRFPPGTETTYHVCQRHKLKISHLFGTAAQLRLQGIRVRRNLRVRHPACAWYGGSHMCDHPPWWVIIMTLSKIGRQKIEGKEWQTLLAWHNVSGSHRRACWSERSVKLSLESNELTSHQSHFLLASWNAVAGL